MSGHPSSEFASVSKASPTDRKRKGRDFADEEPDLRAAEGMDPVVYEGLVQNARRFLVCHTLFTDFNFANLIYSLFIETSSYREAETIYIAGGKAVLFSQHELSDLRFPN